MAQPSYSAIGILLYLIVLAIVAFRSTRRETTEGYAIGARRVGLLPTIASLAAGFRDGAGLAVWVSFAYFFGLGALWLTVGMAVGLVVLAMRAAWLRDRAAVAGYITVGDMIRERIGFRTARIASVVITITAFLYSAAQLYVAGRIFAEMLGVSTELGIALTGVVVGAYLIAGGYQTVIATDVFQWAIIGLIVLLPFFGRLPDVGPLLASVASPGLRNAVGFAGISGLVVFSSADVWQRIFSARSGKTIRAALLLTIPVYFVISVGLVLFGFAARSVLEGVPAEEAFFALFSTDAIAAPIVAIVGIFAAASIMSTLDTQVFLFASTVVKDFGRRANKQGEINFVKGARVVIVPLIGVLVLLAASIGDIIEFLFGAVTLGTTLTPILFLCVWAKGNMKNLDLVLGGVVVISSGVYAFLFANGYFTDIVMTLIPAATSAILCTLVIIGHRLLTTRNNSTGIHG
jgi:Na+/proline symporter